MSTLERFELPCDPQNNSRLLQLPVEIRMIIYKYLLVPRKSPRSIFEMNQVNDHSYFDIYPRYEEEMRSQTQLSSQLLQCCQWMLGEGCSLLYDNTELSIYCRGGDLHILDAQIPIYDLKHILRRLSFDLEPQELTKNAQPSPVYALPDDPSTEMWYFSRIMKSISKIHHFNIIVDEPLCAPLSIFRCGLYACVTRKLFKMKDVRLSFHGQYDPQNALDSDLSLHPSAPNLPEFSLLQIFKIWRCRSLLIYDTKADQRTKDEVIATVTSDKPVYELITRFETLSHGKLYRGRDLEQLLADEGKRTLFTRVREAAYSGNLVEYLRMKNIMEEATKDAMAKRMQEMFDEASEVEEHPR